MNRNGLQESHFPAEHATELPRIVQPTVYDFRFMALLGMEQWSKLPRAVQVRFCKQLTGSGLALYRGAVVEMRNSLAGRLLANACRLIGAPLPIGCEAGTAALVSVSEDVASGGQCWTRIYARRRGFPQVIHSAKRFSGPTGLEEYLGRGVGMALRAEGHSDGIAFISDHYFVIVGKRRFRLPRWLAPGRATINHRDLGDGRFMFELSLDHPMLGRMMVQRVLFEDA